MEDSDLLAARYTNAATLADTVLLLLTRLRRGTATLNDSAKATLDELVTLLRGSANGAASMAERSDLSPMEGRSLSEDLMRYDQVRKVKRDLSDKELNEWTAHAADVVELFRDHGLEADEVKKQAEWIRDGLEPFLEELSQLDGLDGYEHETGIGPTTTTA